MKLFVAAISAFLLATPAWALGPDGEAESHANHGQAAEEDGGERRICRRIDDNTGTRTAGRRVCKTASEWRELSRETRGIDRRVDGRRD